MWDNRPIGVIDSGVGGLTVAKKLMEILPKENIVYFGDNKNVPYGNKSEAEIYKLTKKMMDFLIEKDVKLVAVACNTISSIVDKYFKDYDLPIINIISPAVDYLIEEGIKEIGVLATTFTIESGLYQKLLREKDENIIVITEGSPKLAAAIDSGEYTRDEIRDLVDLHIDNILKKRKVENIVLGCTHFAIVLDEFKKRNPEVNFINPAIQEVEHIDKLVEENSIRGNEKKSSFNIYTTGSRKTYEKMVDTLGIKAPDNIIELE